MLDMTLADCRSVLLYPTPTLLLSGVRGSVLGTLATKSWLPGMQQQSASYFVARCTSCCCSVRGRGSCCVGHGFFCVQRHAH